MPCWVTPAEVLSLRGCLLSFSSYFSFNHRPQNYPDGPKGGLSIIIPPCFLVRPWRAILKFAQLPLLFSPHCSFVLQHIRAHSSLCTHPGLHSCSFKQFTSCYLFTGCMCVMWCMSVCCAVHVRMSCHRALYVHMSCHAWLCVAPCMSMCRAVYVRVLCYAHEGQETTCKSPTLYLHHIETELESCQA